MEKLKHFFWLCSGVNVELLQEARTEATKYVGIGATIFFTGVFAALAASYALFTVFDTVWIASVLGIVWGLMIFNLDRYIVSSMRKEGNSLREFLSALPRLLLAILISIVIAKPLEMKIFEKEIQAEFVIMEQQLFTSQEMEIEQRFIPEQEKLRKEIEILKHEVKDKTLKRDELDRIAQLEADGTGGTKVRNVGPVYKLKKADADRTNDELLALIKQNEKLIQQKLKSISYQDSLLNAEKTTLLHQKFNGPAVRMEALSRLTEKYNSIWWANWFVLLLFVAVETTPVFVKLISSQGPYDHLLKIEEHNFEAKRIEDIATLNASIKERVSKLSETEREFIKERLDIKLNDS